MRRRAPRATGTGSRPGRKPGTERPRRRAIEQSEASGRKPRAEKTGRRTVEHRFQPKKTNLVPIALVVAAVVAIAGIWYFVGRNGDRAYWVALVRLNQRLASQPGGASPQEARVHYRRLPIGSVRDPMLKEMHMLYGKILDASEEPMPETERPDFSDPDFMAKMEARSKVRMAYLARMEEKIGPERRRFMELVDKGLDKYGAVSNPYR